MSILPKNVISPITAEIDKLTDGSLLELPENFIKDRKHLIFSADINSTSDVFKIYVGQGYDTTTGGWLEIDSTYVKVYNYYHFREEPYYPVIEPVIHGLELCGFINVMIEKNAAFEDVAVITTASGQARISVKGIDGCRGTPFTFVKGCTLTDCRLSAVCNCLTDPIWLIGDSYLSHLNSARWPYYLYRDGINRLTMLGYSGMRTEVGIEGFKYALNYAKPKFAVWCLGMNNGDSADGKLDEKWLSATEDFLEICDRESIVPVLSTIPSTPKINNAPKNEWVKASGRRFIDFNRAVGADEVIGWYGGMLSEDLVHPNPLGATALYARVLRDFPEITTASSI